MPNSKATAPVTGVSGPSSPMSYSSVASTQIYPKRDQALVIPAVENIPTREYVIALTKFTPPKNIIFVSKISKERICLYLSSKETLDNILEKTSTINIQNIQLPIRRLISPSKRLIISNVHPCVPNEELEKHLLEIGFTLSSRVTFMGAGFADIPELSHIKSFRRQVYFVPDEDLEIPPSFVITFEDEEFRVFISDEIKCFVCKESGHVAGKCNKQQPNETTTPTSQKAPPENLPETSPTIGAKEDDKIDPSNVQPKNKRKRPKIQTLSSIESEDDALEFDEIKATVLSSNSSITYENVCNILMDVKHQDNPIPYILKYTEDFSNLASLLTRVVREAKLSNKLKARIKKLIKKIIRYNIDSNIPSTEDDDSSH